MARSKKEKEDYARMLFVDQKLTQKEIAERVGVTEKTISKWIKDNGWGKIKKSLLVTKPHNLELMYNTLTKINEDIQDRVPTPADIDKILKQTQSIKNLETDVGLGEIFTVGQYFIAFVRNIEPTKVKEVYALFDAFIQSKTNG